MDDVRRVVLRAESEHAGGRFQPGLEAVHEHDAPGRGHRRGQQDRMVAPRPDPACGPGREAPEPIRFQPLVPGIGALDALLSRAHRVETTSCSGTRFRMTASMSTSNDPFSTPVRASDFPARANVTDSGHSPWPSAHRHPDARSITAGPRHSSVQTVSRVPSSTPAASRPVDASRSAISIASRTRSVLPALHSTLLEGRGAWVACGHCWWRCCCSGGR